MLLKGFLIGFFVLFCEVNTQTFDCITTSSGPVIISNPKSTESKLEEILPALQIIKNSSKCKKERLCNLVKIIKFLLSEEMENKNEANKILEDLKKEIKEREEKDTFPIPDMPDIDSIVEERLKSIKWVIDDKTYMLDQADMNKTETVQEGMSAKNKTDFSRILNKIANALAKVKENQSSDIQTANMVPIFRQRNACNSLLDNLKQRGSSQTGMNSKSSLSMFNIPCQRASDILEETVNFPLPREAFCDNPAVNLNSLAKNTKLNLENLPFNNVVPNSVTVVDSDDTIAILFKPKKISLMQVYGNLLKKITITVLVPYYVSKLAL